MSCLERGAYNTVQRPVLFLELLLALYTVAIPRLYDRKLQQDWVKENKADVYGITSPWELGDEQIPTFAVSAGGTHTSYGSTNSRSSRG